MYIPEHDGELQLALRVIAETRKNLELDGDVAGLESLDRALQIQRTVILASTVRASANRWRKLTNDDDEMEAQALEAAASMSTRAFNRVWRVVEDLRNGKLPGE